MANFILARRDSYLDYLYAGVKQDALSALHTAPVHLQSLSSDQLLIKAEQEVSRSEERGVLLASHIGNPVISIHMLPMTNLLINRIGSHLFQLGSKYVNTSRERKVVASRQAYNFLTATSQGFQTS